MMMIMISGVQESVGGRGLRNSFLISSFVKCCIEGQKTSFCLLCNGRDDELSLRYVL